MSKQRVVNNKPSNKFLLELFEKQQKIESSMKTCMSHAYKNFELRDRFNYDNIFFYFFPLNWCDYYKSILFCEAYSYNETIVFHQTLCKPLCNRIGT